MPEQVDIEKIKSNLIGVFKKYDPAEVHSILEEDFGLDETTRNDMVFEVFKPRIDKLVAQGRDYDEVLKQMSDANMLTSNFYTDTAKGSGEDNRQALDALALSDKSEAPITEGSGADQRQALDTMASTEQADAEQAAEDAKVANETTYGMAGAKDTRQQYYEENPVEVDELDKPVFNNLSTRDIYYAARHREDIASDPIYALEANISGGEALKQYNKHYQQNNKNIIKLIEETGIKAKLSEPDEYGRQIVEVQDKKGNWHAIENEDGFARGTWEALKREKFELLGAVVGGSAATVAAAPLTPVGQVAAGGVGSMAGAFVGSGIDYVIDAVDLNGLFRGKDYVIDAMELKKNMDGYQTLSRMVDRGNMDAIMSILSHAGVRLVGAGASKLRRVIPAVRKYASDVTRNASGALEKLTEELNLKPGEVAEIIDKQITGIEAYIDDLFKLAPNSDRPVEQEIKTLQKQLAEFKALPEGEQVIHSLVNDADSRIIPQIEKSVYASKSKGAKLASMIQEVTKDMREKGFDVSTKDINKITRKLLQDYETALKQDYEATKLVGDRLIKAGEEQLGEKYRWDYNELAIDDLLKIYHASIGDKTEKDNAKAFIESVRMLGLNPEEIVEADLKSLTIKAEEALESLKGQAKAKKIYAKGEAVSRATEAAADNVDNIKQVQFLEKGIKTAETKLKLAKEAGDEASIRTYEKSVRGLKSNLKRVQKEAKLNRAEATLSARKSAERKFDRSIEFDNKFEQAKQDLNEAMAIDKENRPNLLESANKLRGFSNLLELNKTINRKLRSVKFDSAGIDMLEAVSKKVKQEIKDASRLMPDGDTWYKRWLEDQTEWSKFKQVEANELYKALVKEKDVGSVLDTLAKNMSKPDTFNKVVEKLPAEKRKLVEGSMLDHLIKKNEISGIEGLENIGSDSFLRSFEGTHSAIDFVALSNTLNRDYKFISKDSRQLVKLIDRMAQLYQNHPALLKALRKGQAVNENISSGIGSNLKDRVKVFFASRMFNRIKRFLPFGGGRSAALINLVADVIDNPMDMKSVNRLYKMLPEDTELKHWIRKMQSLTYAERGEMKNYDRTKVYVIDSPSHTKYGIGKKAFKTREEAVKAANGKPVTERTVDAGLVAIDADIPKITGIKRQLSESEIRSEAFHDQLKGKGMEGYSPLGENFILVY